MGSTDSQPVSIQLEMQYRLVRRFISEFYGGSEITVIENKQSKQQLALREMILQFNSQQLVNELQERKALTHRNLIKLKNYWLQSDLGICSNLFKLYTLFQYHENTLEDISNDRQGQQWSDQEVVDFVRQMLTALNFLERNQMVYLLSGPKNIAVSDQQHKMESHCDEELTNRTRSLRETIQKQRCSLIDLNRKCINETINQGRFTDLKDARKIRTYKLFEPFEAFTNTRSFYNLQSYMQVPLHPQLASFTQQQILLPQALIKLQNLFTTALIGLGLAEGCDIFELDIFKNGKLSIQKIKERAQKIRNSHPKTSFQILKILAIKNDKCSQQVKTNYKLKDFSLIIRKQDIRTQSQEKLMKITGDNKVKRVISRKRLSLLQV